MNPPIEVEAYVKSLHDGVFTQEGPANRGIVHRIGLAAVLWVGSIDILVCRHIAGNGDSQLYRAFGIEPTFYRLVVVKACTSHKAAYRLFAERMCETEPPGAAGSRRASSEVPALQETAEAFLPLHGRGFLR